MPSLTLDLKNPISTLHTLIVFALFGTLNGACVGGEIDADERLDIDPLTLQLSVADGAQTITAIADGQVAKDTPGTNYGNKTTLGSDTEPVVWSYVRFSVQNTTTITSAKLKLYVTNATANGPKVFLASNTWAENTLNWNNKPAAQGSVVADIANVGSALWIEVDVSSVVRGNGTYSFVFVPDTNDAMYFGSKEQSVAKPQLIINGTATQPPPPLPPSLGDSVVYAAGDVSGLDATFTGDEATARVILNAPRVDAVFALGDLQYNSGEYSKFTTYYAMSWGQPGIFEKTYPVVGNHEGGDPAGPYVGYFRYFGMNGNRTTRPGLPQRTEAFYSFDLGNWHIVALNTDNVTQTQKDWLVADLRNTTKKCVLAMGHHPRYSGATFGPCAQGTPPQMLDVFPLLVAGKVDLYLAGHDHQYQRFAKQDSNGQRNTLGVRQITSGGGGRDVIPMSCGLRSTNPMANLEAQNDKDFGVLKLTLRDNAYDWEFVRAGTALQPADSGTQLGCNRN